MIYISTLSPSLPHLSLSQQLYSDGQSEFLQIQFTKADNGMRNLACTFLHLMYMYTYMYIVCLETP